MIRIQTTKKAFQKEKFAIIDYDISEFQQKVINLDELSKKHKNMVLQIDGGGILGVHPAFNLYCLEAFSQKKKLNQYFNTLWGTSTGAIIAGLVSIGVPAKDILEMYIEKGPDIFERTKFGMFNLLSPNAYDSKFIESLLDLYFGVLLFKDIDIDLNIAVVDPINRETVICNKKTTPFMTLKNAIRASMSAPMYFGPYQFFGKFKEKNSFVSDKQYILFDGGTGTNNCTLEKAVCEFLYDKTVDINDFYVYSLGCGTIINKEETYKDRYDAIVRYKKILQAAWAISFGREESTIKQIKWANYRAIDSGLNFNRFDFLLPKSISAMDDTNNINELMEIIQKQYLMSEVVK